MGDCGCHDFQRFVCERFLEEQVPDDVSEATARELVSIGVTGMLREYGYAHLAPPDPNVVWSVCRQRYVERVIASHAAEYHAHLR